MERETDYHILEEKMESEDVAPRMTPEYLAKGRIIEAS